MYNITDEIRQTYAIHDKFKFLLDYGSFSQVEWNEWSVFKIEGMFFYVVR
jgi:hypothetical protein